MKTLVLVRHAKSSWDDPNVADFDRPLNERGKRDAPMMADRLHERRIPIDMILSSPAKRAVKTAQAFAKAYEIDRERFICDETLYMADIPAFIKAIRGLDDSWDHVALISHNHGITEFANHLEVAKIDVMPTCGIFALRSDALKWQDFESSRRKYWFFDYPKNPSPATYAWPL